MKSLELKFMGFFYTLLALVLLVMFGKDLPYGEIAVGGLLAIATGQGRDLYRKESNDVGTTFGEGSIKDNSVSDAKGGKV